MILDCDRYRANVPHVEAMTRGKTPAERLSIMSVLSISTHVPILIIACYLGEIYGFTDELKAFIESATFFYQVKEIRNIKVVAQDANS